VAAALGVSNAAPKEWLAGRLRVALEVREAPELALTVNSAESDSRAEGLVPLLRLAVEVTLNASDRVPEGVPLGMGIEGLPVLEALAPLDVALAFALTVPRALRVGRAVAVALAGVGVEEVLEVGEALALPRPALPVRVGAALPVALALLVAVPVALAEGVEVALGATVWLARALLLSPPPRLPVAAALRLALAVAVPLPHALALPLAQCVLLLLNTLLTLASPGPALPRAPP
jgi:hypothetical protein